MTVYDRSLLTSLALGRRGFNTALDVPCTVHDAPAGQACWTFGPRQEALCGRRVGIVGLRRRRR